MANPAWMVQLGQAAQGLIKRQMSGAGDKVADGGAAPARPDPLSMAESARMRSLAHTRELMSRRTR